MRVGGAREEGMEKKMQRAVQGNFALLHLRVGNDGNECEGKPPDQGTRVQFGEENAKEGAWGRETQQTHVRRETPAQSEIWEGEVEEDFGRTETEGVRRKVKALLMSSAVDRS
ncbi:hypothetical protein ERJ75_000657700 [Trypanosoma vivax]|nr:hypothetical protein ERJ75_000657700 [Trypanosoma vivax]